MQERDTLTAQNVAPQKPLAGTLTADGGGDARQAPPPKGKVLTGFNGLSATQWTALSKNVWNDLSSPRNRRQLEHGAVFPIKLAERLISIYSKKRDAVLDPFAGIGTTLVAAQSMERHALGLELNPDFVAEGGAWIAESGGLLKRDTRCVLVNDDCRNLAAHVRPDGIQLTVTSPPYANFIRRSVKDRKKTHKKSLIVRANNSTVKPYSDDPRDFGNLAYARFLLEIEDILRLNFTATRKGGYSAWVVKDYRDTGNKIPYVAFHSDLAAAGERAGFRFHDLIVWDQTGQRRLVLLGFPSVFYTNQNCSFIVIFRKC